MPLYAAGTLPLPAVSVARPKDTRPAPTDTADPEDEPPDMCRLLNTLWGRPYGDRQPERPVASWSRLTLPINSPPASRTCCTAGALDVGVYSYCAQAAVVGIPATSIVSFTENGTPKSGGSGFPAYLEASFSAAVRQAALDSRWIHTAEPCCSYSSMRSYTRLAMSGGVMRPFLYREMSSSIGGSPSWPRMGGVEGGVSDVKASVAAAKKSELLPTKPKSPSWPATMSSEVET